LAVAFALLAFSCSPTKNQPTNWNQLLEQFNTVQNEVRVPVHLIATRFKETPFAGIWVDTEARPLLLLLDTGAGTTVLRESHRNLLDLNEFGQVAAEGGVGRPATTNLAFYTTSSLSLNGFPLQNETVAFMDDREFDEIGKNSGKTIDGLLGATLLQRGEIDLDVPARVLTLRSFDKNQVEQSQYSIPLVHFPDKNGYAIPLTNQEGKTGRFLLDTGTNAVLVLNEKRPFGQAAVRSQSIGNLDFQTLHGEGSVSFYGLPGALFMRGRVFAKGTPVAVAPRDDRLEGTVGIPLVWSSRRVILNHRKELAAFDPIDPNQTVPASAPWIGSPLSGPVPQSGGPGE
jgi:hypothetical protein